MIFKNILATKGNQEDEIDAAETSAETTNLTHSSLVPDLLTAERFLEENPEGILPYDESCVSASELSDEDFIDDDDYECLSVETTIIFLSKDNFKVYKKLGIGYSRARFSSCTVNSATYSGLFFKTPFIKIGFRRFSRNPD